MDVCIHMYTRIDACMGYFIHICLFLHVIRIHALSANLYISLPFSVLHYPSHFVSLVCVLIDIMQYCHRHNHCTQTASNLCSLLCPVIVEARELLGNLIKPVSVDVSLHRRVDATQHETRLQLMPTLCRRCVDVVPTLCRRCVDVVPTLCRRLLLKPDLVE